MTRLIYFVPALSYMGLIFYLSATLPPPMLTDWPEWNEIGILHIVEFGGLAALLMLGFLRGTRLSLPRVMLYAAAVSIIYGISDEWHQSFVPQRVPSAGDLLADTIGSILAVACYAFALRWKLFPNWLKRNDPLSIQPPP